MSDEMKTLCDLWEAESPVHLPHSRLYHLDPIGVGSPLVESLTSYVARLSGMHSVSPSALVRKQILPFLNRPSLTKDGSPVSTFLGQQSVALNSLTATASAFVQAVEQLTLRRDLSLLTMLPYKDVLSGVTLLRRTKAWCSCCYEQRREAKQAIYEPLLWMLSVVTLCPQHAQPLEMRCPNPECARQQLPLTARCQPGYCTWCGQWLGSRKKRNHLKLTDEERTEQLQNAEMVGALLAATCNISVKYLKETFALTISACVDKVATGNITVFANLLQVRTSTVWQWQHGQDIPQLEMLVKVAAFLDISLVDLLMGQMKASTLSPAMRQDGDVPPDRSRKQRRWKRGTRKRLREALEAVMQTPEDPPSSMPEVASRLGYDYRQLRKEFPDLCQSISSQYASYRAKQRVERQQRLCEEVRQAIQTLHAQDCYPSKRQVSKLLTTPGIFWEPEVYRTWKEMIQQLGWRQ